MPGAYVTFYTFTVFIVPFFILTYTHVIICREIWLNWHSKRQSLMVKDRHLTKPKLPMGGEGGSREPTYLLANSASSSSKVGGEKVNLSSSGLRGLAHHALPHSPLPTSKGHSSRHSPSAASGHFFAKCTTTTTAENSSCSKEPLQTTTTLNRHVSSKCSRTLNRLLWICNKSSSVSSNSSGVSTSTNSSASSHRASFSGQNVHCHSGHEHKHHHHHHNNTSNNHHHHHSTPSLVLTSTLLCPLHDKQGKVIASLMNEEQDHSGLSSAADTPARSNGYGPVDTTTVSTTVVVSATHQGTVLQSVNFIIFFCVCI